MNTLSLIRKGLTRNKVQFVLTALSVFIAFCLFGMLSAFRHAFEAGVDLSQTSRLVTFPRAGLSESLPLGYWKEIEGIDGVYRVTHFTIFNGYYQDQRNTLNAFGVDAATIAAVYDAEMPITPGQLEAWIQVRDGAAVGRVLADNYGWREGSRVPLVSQSWLREDALASWDFEISVILDIPQSSPYAANFFFHYDYLDEARAVGKSTVGYYVLRVLDSHDAQTVATRIDERFANSAAETRTSTEKALFEFLARQFGDVGTIVAAILSAVFFTILLVIGNSMSRSVRERTRELIVMRSIGFSDAKVAALVILEGILLTLLPGVLALIVASVLSAGLGASFATILPGVRLTGGAILVAVALMLLLGLASSILPVLRVIRMNVAAGLARR